MKWLRLKILTERQNTFFRTVVNSTIEERRKKNIVRNDMLHLMLLAKEGKLNEQIKENEHDQDTGFATIAEVIQAKTSEKLKSNDFYEFYFSFFSDLFNVFFFLNMIRLDG